MKNQIIIREAISEADTADFWEQLHSYHKRDIFPDPEDENLKHFLSDTEYRVQIEHVHNRLQDRCYYLFFERNGQDIGLRCRRSSPQRTGNASFWSSAFSRSFAAAARAGSVTLCYWNGRRNTAHAMRS